MRQLQQAMKAGGGNVYVSFLPELQSGTDKAPPVMQVRNLMDDMGAPMAETGANADVADTPYSCMPYPTT